MRKGYFSSLLAGELFKQQTGTFITHIPYRGAGPALQDVVAGRVDMMFDGLASSAAHLRSGRLRALMVAGKRRNPAFPQIPCAAELGLPTYTMQSWYGVWGPKGLPVALQQQIVACWQVLRAREALRTVWASYGAELPELYSQAFGRYVHSELLRWNQVVTKAGITVD